MEENENYIPEDNQDEITGNVDDTVVDEPTDEPVDEPTNDEPTEDEPVEDEEETCEILPLPFEYDEEDKRIELINEIIRQVSSYCGYKLITEEKPQGDITVEELWKKIWLILRFISLATCWTDTYNDLFIMQTRTQQATAKQICGCRQNCCNCDDDAIVIPLDYAPLLDDEECMYVSGVMSVVINGRVERVEIPTDYLYEHTDTFTNKLYIMREDFPEILYNHNMCCCLCKRQLTITLQYNAGYRLLPAGLLPVICPLLSKIEDAKLGNDDCASAMTQVVGLLKRKKVGNVEYEWSDKAVDNDMAKTQALFTDIFDISLIAEIQSISRCDSAVGAEEMGDVV